MRPSTAWPPALVHRLTHMADARGAPQGEYHPGLLADMAVLDTNYATCAPTDILHIKVDMTIVGGKYCLPAQVATLESPNKRWYTSLCIGAPSNARPEGFNLCHTFQV
jgi:hypothetical protein